MAAVAYALGVFVVFGAVGLAMARSATATWRQGSEEGDRLDQWSGLEQWWPALLAFAVAIGAPLMILFG
jgi:hypothetical protein